MNRVSLENKKKGLELLEDRSLSWWTEETADSLLKKIFDDPTNAEARYKFCLLMPQNKILECMENSLWLIKNTEVQIDSVAITHAFHYNSDHPFAREARDVALSRFDRSKATFQDIITFADFLLPIDSDKIVELIEFALSIAPENEYVIGWAAFKFEMIIDNKLYKKRAIELYRKRNRMPWRQGATYQFEMLRHKFGKILVTNWVRKPLLYASSIFCPESHFDRSRRLARLGILLLDSDNQKQLADIEDEILPLLQDTVAHSWFFPLIAGVFNFLAIQQLRRGNLTMAKYYLVANIQHKATSEFSFLFDCKDWIDECRKLGYHDFAANLLEEKGINILDHPSVTKIISLVRNGKNPWPNFIELDEKSKIERVIDLLKDFVSLESQLAYIKRLPYLFLSQSLYQALHKNYKLRDWVPNSLTLSEEQKKLMLEIMDLIRNPPSKVNFIGEIPPEETQKNEDWLLITEKIYTVYDSLKTLNPQN